MPPSRIPAIVRSLLIFIGSLSNSGYRLSFNIPILISLYFGTIEFPSIFFLLLFTSYLFSYNLFFTFLTSFSNIIISLSNRFFFINSLLIPKSIIGLLFSKSILILRYSAIFLYQIFSCIQLSLFFLFLSSPLFVVALDIYNIYIYIYIICSFHLNEDQLYN